MSTMPTGYVLPSICEKYVCCRSAGIRASYSLSIIKFSNVFSLCPRPSFCAAVEAMPRHAWKSWSAVFVQEQTTGKNRERFMFF